jgi:hypothetical protein
MFGETSDGKHMQVGRVYRKHLHLYARRDGIPYLGSLRTTA